jgi:hypothetical protein
MSAGVAARTRHSEIFAAAGVISNEHKPGRSSALPKAAGIGEKHQISFNAEMNKEIVRV